MRMLALHLLTAILMDSRSGSFCSETAVCLQILRKTDWTQLKILDGLLVCLKTKNRTDFRFSVQP